MHVHIDESMDDRRRPAAQTLAQFEAPVASHVGRLYMARACGRERDGGTWEGWIEFEDRETGEVLRSSRETTQPNMTDLAYWASGLTPVYLEGSLARTLTPTIDRGRPEVSPPAFDGPADSEARRRPVTEAVLDPFSVYEKSPDVLAQELTALRGYHLRQIVRRYTLASEDEIDLEALTEPELAALIVARVGDRYRSRH